MTTLGKHWVLNRKTFTQKCAECGKLFNPITHNQIRCSARCRYESQKRYEREKWRMNYVPRIIKTNCAVCGKYFEYKGNARPITCSKDCSNKRRNALPYLFTIEHRLKHMMRQALNTRMRISRKKRQSAWYANYSAVELKSHLESLFKKGMSWENYGRTGWHIDHIRPLSSFNFFDENGCVQIAEVRKAMALENLQPLWACENMSKHDTYELKVINI